MDTSVCATSVRKISRRWRRLKDTVVLAISKDLPFAHARFCTTEGIENVVPLSDFRYSDFDESYGVRMADGPLACLLARSVVDDWQRWHGSLYGTRAGDYSGA